MPDEAAAFAILDKAWSGGITSFDTAPHYGDAESRLGRWIEANGHAPFISTKFRSLRNCSDVDIFPVLENQCRESLRSLRVRTIDAYLAHDAGDLARPAVVAALRVLMERGWVHTFGVSAYEAEDILAVLDIAGLGMVQAPLSVLDRRLIERGVLEACAERHVAFFARSVFLQGLIFLDPGALPRQLEAAAPAIRRLSLIADRAGVSVATLALAAVLECPHVRSVVIGVDDGTQLTNNLLALGTDVVSAAVAELRQCRFDLPANVLDPRRWPDMLDPGAASRGRGDAKPWETSA